MKKAAFLLIIVVILSSFGLVCHADERVSEYVEDFEKILPEQLEDLAEGEGTVERLGVRAVFGEIMNALSGESSAVRSFFLTLIGVLVMLGFSSSLDGRLGDTASAAVGVICSLLIFSQIAQIFAEVAVNLERINGFFLSLVPITVGVTALGGGTSTASVQGIGMYTTLSVVSKLSGGFFTSVSGFGLSMSLISGFGGEKSARVGKGVRNLFNTAVCAVTAIIGGTLSLQTMVSSAKDCAAMRAARYAASGMIPVVGSTVSGALSTLASGLAYAKGIIGGGSVAVIVSLALAPLVMLLLYRLALSVAVGASGFLGIAAAERCFDSYRFALDTVIAVYSLSCVLYIFEIILFIKSGVALL